MYKNCFGEESNKIALCWTFYCVNDNKEVNVITFQTMSCIFCHNNPILNVNPKIQARKGLIIYIGTNGICIEETCQFTSYQYFKKV